MEPVVVGVSCPVQTRFSAADVSRIIEMAWDDQTPFEAIEQQFHLGEAGVIRLMRTQLQRGSFKAWRRRVRGRVAKHSGLQFARSGEETQEGKARRPERFEFSDPLSVPLHASLAEPAQQHSNFF